LTKKDNTIFIPTDQVGMDEDVCCCHCHVTLCCHTDMKSIYEDMKVQGKTHHAGRYFWSVFALSFKCFAIFLVMFLVCWNVTKLPYYFVSDELQPATNVTWNAARCGNEKGVSDVYWCYGLEGSINLEHWVKGYHGGKLHTPSIFFVGLHAIMGCTVLTLSTLTIVWPQIRKRFGYSFFILAFILGAHTFPSTLLVSPFPKLVLFAFTAVGVMICSLIGFGTLIFQNKIKEPYVERIILACYIIISIGACGAGMAEFYSIFSRSMKKQSLGYWPSDGPRPDPMTGHSVYDGKGLEAFGIVFSIGWIAVVCVIMPIMEILKLTNKIPQNFWLSFSGCWKGESPNNQKNIKIN